ncbi:putative ribosome biogenesis protein [Venturia nashicola]|nr:putative ribosome biogenesis protein [Venturia nashicola]
MPFLEVDAAAGRKRKRPVKDGQKTKSKKTAKAPSVETDDQEEKILQLEAQVLESRKYYNNIAALLSLAKNDSDTSVLARVAICRIYCRLLAAGNLKAVFGAVESELVIVRWLKARLDEYLDLVLASSQLNSTTLTLVMRLVREEIREEGTSAWENGIFPRLTQALLTSGTSTENLRAEYNLKYFQEYDDVRFQTLGCVVSQDTEVLSASQAESFVNASLDILSTLDEPPEHDEEISNFFAERPTKPKDPMVLVSGHRKRAQAAWLALLKTRLSKENRKTILGMMVHRIVPWFKKIELLMDFLTDSYNQGGATSLLALSGLFYLMQEKNLDYPSFYTKLYSQLDDTILQSKHRSRFFRLLDTFMSSTHLPAALVASFIKRLARLSLAAPPGSIVVVVPWIYNMFKRHPQASFMIHREPRTPEQLKDWEEHGFKDPFSMNEMDPMLTGALESSIWEIEMLQSHYHPNVATLAKIISEQFTKLSYNLDDFLDYSYKSLLDAELEKSMKKTPVVEYQIPKHIFLAEGGSELNSLGSLFTKAFEE